MVDLDDNEAEKVLATFDPLAAMIAAEQTERKAFLTELDPLYCDVIVQRYEKFTGKKAERVRIEQQLAS